MTPHAYARRPPLLLLFQRQNALDLSAEGLGLRSNLCRPGVLSATGVFQEAELAVQERPDIRSVGTVLLEL